ncbi:MAG TPA: hypothetical protein EYP16_00825 [Candidatus Atribacteria bacterium]|nr:hypothetical protein [Candidatus Atribacteria bacterium]
MVIDAFQTAIWPRRPQAGLIFHSGRDSQYCSKDFQNMLTTHRILSSMSCKGDCWNNSVAESFSGSLKTE